MICHICLSATATHVYRRNTRRAQIGIVCEPLNVCEPCGQHMQQSYPGYLTLIEVTHHAPAPK